MEEWKDKWKKECICNSCESRCHDKNELVTSCTKYRESKIKIFK